MSAIVGIINFNKEPIAIGDRNGMMNELQKYPADDVQTWQQGNIFLGCHAQWITPESVGEKLPYYDPDRKLSITADAIIDNREELFDALQVSKALRANMPDSKLILLSYQKWGEESLKYLIGDFAFMIWDENEQKFFGARDFSGSRTLYYFHRQHRFVFSTTITPMFSLPYVDKYLNEEWLAEFLAIPGMHDSSDEFTTAYKWIYQIPPSHTISVKDNKVRFQRYCNLIEESSPLRFKSDEEYEEAFRQVFQKAVDCRTRTHGQVGAQLSGGLDSGTVVSFAAPSLKRANKTLHTMSYLPLASFEDWTPKRRVADESFYIRTTVNHVGNINDQYYRFEDRNPYLDIDDWLKMVEMPYKFYGNSFWTKGIYEHAQNQGMRILLKGSRGNYTISWGSALDHYTNLFKKMKWIKLYREVEQYSRNVGVGRKRVLNSIQRKAFYPLRSRLSPTSQSYSFPQIISNELARKTGVFEKLNARQIDTAGSYIPNAKEARQSQFDQLFFWNLNGTIGTKLSLRYGVWERDPTNDLRVIRFCLSLPDNQYVQNGQDRALVRRSTANYLPDKIRLNQKVRGIQGADVIQRMEPTWDTFLKEVRQLTRDPTISEFINGDVIDRGVSKFANEPKPETVFNHEFKVLIRSVIVYRFLKSFI
ncbi:asparagine synthase-related protein [Halobacillus amylolyticus]|uniref:asparagine synthase (glutamine-hydrolyzing) n=1 Tax=Halobacillus amylolyticus TaxID=2932259 RepID=A0ABY4HFW4_9BACI|nr:asparagine synthase-related protein [Halobacillus amylolyticus]UOR13779.1 asparagine synthase-related protein [Halobacillus amylolyticus]